MAYSLDPDSMHASSQSHAGSTPGDGFSDRARRQLQRLVGRFRRSFTGVRGRSVVLLSSFQHAAS